MMSYRINELKTIKYEQIFIYASLKELAFSNFKRASQKIILLKQNVHKIKRC